MFFIKVENGATVDHPVALENLRLIYPTFDISNPPDGYLQFNRASVPATTDTYIIHEANYVISDNSVSEVYIARTMTAEEKQQLFELMEQRKPYPSWILNQTNCQWEPPVAYPLDNNKYAWNEDTLQWNLVESPTSTT